MTLKVSEVLYVSLRPRYFPLLLASIDDDGDMFPVLLVAVARSSGAFVVSSNNHNSLSEGSGVCFNYRSVLVQWHRHGTLQCLVTIVSLQFVIVLGV